MLLDRLSRNAFTTASQRETSTDRRGERAALHDSCIQPNIAPVVLDRRTQNTAVLRSSEKTMNWWACYFHEINRRFTGRIIV